MQIQAKPLTNIDVLEKVSIKGDIEESLVKARCNAYSGKETTETYFSLQIQMGLYDFSHIETTISSGKYLNKKATLVRVNNKDGDTLEFGFHNNQIIFSDANGGKIDFDYTPDGNIQAYEQVLERLYLGDASLFISPEIAMEGLRIIAPVFDTDVQLKVYETGVNPSELS